MKYNLPVNTPILARIARAMDDNISGTPEEMAEKGIHSVRKLIDDVGTSAHLRHQGRQQNRYSGNGSFVPHESQHCRILRGMVQAGDAD
jgi:alcohol dehydrogenase class IV